MNEPLCALEGNQGARSKFWKGLWWWLSFSLRRIHSSFKDGRWWYLPLHQLLEIDHQESQPISLKSSFPNEEKGGKTRIGIFCCCYSKNGRIYYILHHLMFLKFVMGKQWKQWQTLFSWAPKSLQTVAAAMTLKDACTLEEKLSQT